MPPSDSTATSVVPPPTSTTIDPVGSVTGRPAPIAAAIGSSIRKTRLAPALSADSWIARRSTGVEPDGTQTMICGVAKLRRLCTLRMKCLIISSVTSKSAMTPSRSGRIARMLPGVRPSISFASSPTARTCFLPRTLAIATTDGSFSTLNEGKMLLRDILDPHATYGGGFDRAVVFTPGEAMATPPAGRKPASGYESAAKIAAGQIESERGAAEAKDDESSTSPAAREAELTQ